MIPNVFCLAYVAGMIDYEPIPHQDESAICSGGGEGCRIRRDRSRLAHNRHRSTIGRAPGDIRAACCRKSRACRATSIAEALTYKSNIRERSFFGLLGPSISPARENAVGNPDCAM